jgi:hypothetical protein
MNVKCSSLRLRKRLCSGCVDIGTIKRKQKTRVRADDHKSGSKITFEALIEFSSLFSIEHPLTRSVTESRTLCPVHRRCGCQIHSGLDHLRLHHHLFSSFKLGEYGRKAGQQILRGGCFHGQSVLHRLFSVKP